MTPSWTRTRAIAAATTADLLRRPGARLAVLGVAVLLALLPDLAARALDDGGSLATELSYSTAGLVLSVIGGVAGLYATAPRSPVGPAAELVSSPLGWGEYVAGRFLGILAGCAIVLAFLAVAAGVGGALGGAGVTVPAAAPALLGLGGLLLQAALMIAVGALLGSLLPVPAGMVLLLGFLVASRLIVPELSGEGVGVLAVLVPDPARLDLAREIGFARPISSTAALLAWAGAATQVVALLLGSVVVLGNRESG